MNQVIINLDSTKKTVEFVRENSGTRTESVLFPNGFEVQWRPFLDPTTFEVFSEDNVFVIAYREIDTVTYPTELSFYDYLKDLSDYSSSSGGGSTADSTAANQVLQIAEAEEANDKLLSIDEKLRLKECTYFDLSTSIGVPFGGYPITVTQLEWKSLLYQFPIVPNVIVNSDQEFVDLWNLTIAENTLSVFGVNQFCVKSGTEEVLTNPADAITVTTTGGPLIFSVNDFLQGIEPSVSNLDEILLKIDSILSNTNLLQRGSYDVGTITTIQTYAPGVANEAVLLLPSNPNRHSVYVYVVDKSVVIRPLDATVDPADRKGHIVNKEETFALTMDNSNDIYPGEISLINAKDGEFPTYFVVEYVKV